MSKIQESYRLVVLRCADGSTRETTVRTGVMSIGIPYVDGWRHAADGLHARPSFGRTVYAWNGRDHTVSGLPVYR